MRNELIDKMSYHMFYDLFVQISNNMELIKRSIPKTILNNTELRGMNAHIYAKRINWMQECFQNGWKNLIPLFNWYNRNMNIDCRDMLSRSFCINWLPEQENNTVVYANITRINEAYNSLNIIMNAAEKVYSALLRFNIYVNKLSPPNCTDYILISCDYACENFYDIGITNRTIRNMMNYLYSIANGIVIIQSRYRNVNPLRYTNRFYAVKPVNNNLVIKGDSSKYPPSDIYIEELKKMGYTDEAILNQIIADAGYSLEDIANDEKNLTKALSKILSDYADKNSGNDGLKTGSAVLGVISSVTDTAIKFEDFVNDPSVISGIDLTNSTIKTYKSGEKLVGKNVDKLSAITDGIGLSTDLMEGWDCYIKGDYKGACEKIGDITCDTLDLGESLDKLLKGTQYDAATMYGLKCALIGYISFAINIKNGEDPRDAVMNAYADTFEQATFGLVSADDYLMAVTEMGSDAATIYDYLEEKYDMWPIVNGPLSLLGGIDLWIGKTLTGQNSLQKKEKEAIEARKRAIVNTIERANTMYESFGDDYLKQYALSTEDVSKDEFAAAVFVANFAGENVKLEGLLEEYKKYKMNSISKGNYNYGFGEFINNKCKEYEKDIAKKLAFGK